MRRLTLLLSLAIVGGCALADLKHPVVDLVVGSAYRPRPSRGTVVRRDERLVLLAGDMHCHVLPPDGEPHVVRGLVETLALARTEALDFVVLTPHIRARYFQTSSNRAAGLAAHQQLRRDIRALDADDVLLIPGFEYTDYDYGHVGMAFGDLEATFKKVPPSRSRRDPGALFDTFRATGGLLVINHPLLTPTRSPLAVSTWDLSWRPLFGVTDVPPDVAAIDTRADAFEAFNLAVTHLRDRFLLGDSHASLVAILERFDQRILERERRQTPVGGSDSHGHHLRATTFVWSASRTPRAIGDAIRRGRTCIRSPEACAFTARAVGGTNAIVGDAIRGERIRFENHAAPTEVFLNGHIVGTITPEKPRTFDVDPARCTLARARTGLGYSAPIYINCPFAERAF